MGELNFLVFFFPGSGPESDSISRFVLDEEGGTGGGREGWREGEKEENVENQSSSALTLIETSPDARKGIAQLERFVVVSFENQVFGFRAGTQWRIPPGHACLIVVRPKPLQGDASWSLFYWQCKMHSAYLQTFAFPLLLSRFFSPWQASLRRRFPSLRVRLHVHAWSQVDLIFVSTCLISRFNRILFHFYFVFFFFLHFLILFFFSFCYFFFFYYYFGSNGVCLQSVQLKTNVFAPHPGTWLFVAENNVFICSSRSFLSTWNRNDRPFWLLFLVSYFYKYDNKLSG